MSLASCMQPRSGVGRGDRFILPARRQIPHQCRMVDFRGKRPSRDSVAVELRLFRWPRNAWVSMTRAESDEVRRRRRREDDRSASEDGILRTGSKRKLALLRNLRSTSASNMPSSVISSVSHICFELVLRVVGLSCHQPDYLELAWSCDCLLLHFFALALPEVVA